MGIRDKEMTVKEAVKQAWETGYFLSYRSLKEIESKLLNSYGVTCANISVILSRCNFLRRADKGWIQRFGATNHKSPKGIDYFSLLKLHSEIKKVSKKLFDDEHYAQAIFEVFKRVNVMVKERSGRPDLDGKSLMLHAFSPNTPLLKFNKMASQSDKDEQEGMMYLFCGAMQAIRNPKGHENVVLKDKLSALKYLAFASLLCERLNETQDTSPRK